MKAHHSSTDGETPSRLAGGCPLPPGPRSGRSLRSSGWMRASRTDLTRWASPGGGAWSPHSGRAPPALAQVPLQPPKNCYPITTTTCFLPTEAAISALSLTAWLPPLAAVSCLWATAGSHSVPSTWHFVTLWASIRGLSSRPAPCQAARQCPAAGATLPGTVPLHRAARDVCSDEPQLSTAVHAASSDARRHPRPLRSNRHSRETAGVGVKLKWQKSSGLRESHLTEIRRRKGLCGVGGTRKKA